MVSTRKKKNQQKRQLIQVDETLNDSVIGNSVNVNVSESGNLEQQTSGQSNDFERIDNSVRQNQVIENKIDDQITRAVCSPAMTVKNCMHDAILTAVDNVVISRGEMAVKLITGSAGHGTSSEIQNPDRRDFLVNIRNTPLMLASSRLDLDNELNRKDETRIDVDSEDGDFPALKPNYEWREHAHQRRHLHSTSDSTLLRCFSTSSISVNIFS